MMADLDILIATLNELLERTGEVFAKLQVSTSVPAGHGCKLGFKKTNRAWRLMWTAGNNPPTFLSDTSLETRIFAVGFIPALHKALLGEREARAAEIRKAVDELEAFLVVLEESHGSVEATDPEA